jgi:hypothetical protein
LIGLSNLALQAGGADALLDFHEPAAPLMLHFLGEGAGKLVRGSTIDRRILEAADAVELCFLEELEQFLEFHVALAGEADDEGAAEGDVRADRTPGADALEHFLGARRALHELQDARAGVLERHVEVGKDLALGHQRDDFVDVRVRVDVVQAYPHAEITQGAAQLGHAGLGGFSAHKAGSILDVHAVGAGVL